LASLLLALGRFLNASGIARILIGRALTQAPQGSVLLLGKDVKRIVKVGTKINNKFI